MTKYCYTLYGVFYKGRVPRFQYTTVATDEREEFNLKENESAVPLVTNISYQAALSYWREIENKMFLVKAEYKNDLIVPKLVSCDSYVYERMKHEHDS